jgi:hypothetical protein
MNEPKHVAVELYKVTDGHSPYTCATHLLDPEEEGTVMLGDIPELLAQPKRVRFQKTKIFLPGNFRSVTKVPPEYGP